MFKKIIYILKKKEIGTDSHCIWIFVEFTWIKIHPIFFKVLKIKYPFKNAYHNEFIPIIWLYEHCSHLLESHNRMPLEHTEMHLIL